MNRHDNYYRFLIHISVGVALAASLLEEPVAAQRKRPLDALAADMQPTRIVVYKRMGDRELKMHVFEPKNHRPADRRAAFVIFHGGGWTGGSPRRTYPFADYFCQRGMVAICVEYRLLQKQSKVTVFDCVRDGRSAIRYLREHADTFGVDATKIVAAGCSAGGHVAAGTAIFIGVDEDSDDVAVSPKPNAMVLYYPVIDTSIDGYGQKKIGKRWREISPVHRVAKDLPPTILFHGTADTVTPYAGAAEFAERMRKAENQCELISHPGGVHGHLIFELPLFKECMRKTHAFLTQHGMETRNGD